MNNLDFLQMLGNLPESYYSECMPKKTTVHERKKTFWYSAAAFAACIGIVFTFGYMFLHHENIAEPSNTTVSMMTETTSMLSFGVTSKSTEESEHITAVTTDTEITTLTTDQTTIVIIPAFS